MARTFVWYLDSENSIAWRGSCRVSNKAIQWTSRPGRLVWSLIGFHQLKHAFPETDMKSTWKSTHIYWQQGKRNRINYCGLPSLWLVAMHTGILLRFYVLIADLYDFWNEIDYKNYILRYGHHWFIQRWACYVFFSHCSFSAIYYVHMNEA